MKRGAPALAIKRIGIAAGIAVSLALAASVSFAQEPQSGIPETPIMAPDTSATLLESGFRDLYNLNFEAARNNFSEYQKKQPADPMGKAAEASSYLFQEFTAKGVLTSDFFLNDDKFLKGVDGPLAQNANPEFVRTNNRARSMAKQQLKLNPRDTNAMLILTMTDGMESDYDALIEKKQLAAVSLTRQAENEATALLALDPNAQDAYVALGAGHYIIGCLPSYKRAFLWFGGIHGDKQLGMQEVGRAAEHAHYLKPFAKILLALAFERERHPDRARPLLAQLAEQYPNNSLFVHELALLPPTSPAATDK